MAQDKSDRKWLANAIDCESDPIRAGKLGAVKNGCSLNPIIGWEPWETWGEKDRSPVDP